jgi:uncharacterized protein (DUF433 family)
MSHWERIEVNPAICSGKPVIRGTRIMVRQILDMAAEGDSIDQMLQDYPSLKREDVVAALQYASELVDEVKVIVA